MRGLLILSLASTRFAGATWAWIYSIKTFINFVKRLLFGGTIRVKISIGIGFGIGVLRTRRETYIKKIFYLDLTTLDYSDLQIRQIVG